VREGEVGAFGEQEVVLDGVGGSEGDGVDEGVDDGEGGGDLGEGGVDLLVGRDVEVPVWPRDSMRASDPAFRRSL
jgi:hypothetical protein